VPPPTPKETTTTTSAAPEGETAGIPQNGAGDADADNSGGPSDRDGNR